MARQADTYPSIWGRRRLKMPDRERGNDFLDGKCGWIWLSLIFHLNEREIWQLAKKLLKIKIPRRFLDNAGLCEIFIWCRETELNCPRRDFQSLALPTELSRHEEYFYAFPVWLASFFIHLAEQIYTGARPGAGNFPFPLPQLQKHTRYDCLLEGRGPGNAL